LITNKHRFLAIALRKTKEELSTDETEAKLAERKRISALKFHELRGVLISMINLAKFPTFIFFSRKIAKSRAVRRASCRRFSVEKFPGQPKVQLHHGFCERGAPDGVGFGRTVQG